MQYDWRSYRNRKFSHVQREDDVKTQGEDDHLQSQERGLEQILLQRAQ